MKWREVEYWARIVLPAWWFWIVKGSVSSSQTQGLLGMVMRGFGQIMHDGDSRWCWIISWSEVVFSCFIWLYSATGWSYRLVWKEVWLQLPFFYFQILGLWVISLLKGSLAFKWVWENCIWSDYNSLGETGLKALLPPIIAHECNEVGCSISKSLLNNWSLF